MFMKAETGSKSRTGTAAECQILKAPTPQELLLLRLQSLASYMHLKTFFCKFMYPPYASTSTSSLGIVHPSNPLDSNITRFISLYLWFIV